MEGIQTDNAPTAVAGDTAATRNGPTTTSMKPPKLTVAQLLQKLEGLLLLEGAEPYRRWWDELKAVVTEPSRTRRVTADNEYIAKLIETVETMATVNKKQQQFTAAPTYA